MTTNRSGTRGVARPEREALIVDAAVVEFGLGGYSATSVAAIAARAGVSKALVLAYFGNKDALYCRSVAVVAEPMLERIEVAVEQSPPGWPMALATIEAIALSVEAQPRNWILVDEIAPVGNDAAADELAAIERRFRDLSTRGVRALGASEARGFDGRDEDLLSYIWESVVSAAMSWWIARPDETILELLARGSRIIRSLSAG